MKPKFDRGFKALYRKASFAKHRIASCDCCKYQDEGTKECTKPGVIYDDIIDTGDRHFCTFWEPFDVED